MVAISALGYPLLAPLTGRPWTTAETFGVAADPDDPGMDLTGWTFLIGFLRSDVRVSDMSFDITSGPKGKQASNIQIA